MFVLPLGLDSLLEDNYRVNLLFYTIDFKSFLKRLFRVIKEISQVRMGKMIPYLPE